LIFGLSIWINWDNNEVKSNTLAGMTDATWMVRAGNDNELVNEFVENSLFAIGWSDIGDLSKCTNRDQIKEQYRLTYEKRKKGGVNTDSAQLHMVVNRIEVGDRVLTYDKDAREYYVGEVKGEYEYQAAGAPTGYPHTRSVDWDSDTLSRDKFSTSAQNTLGGAMTVFSLDNIQDEIKSLLQGEPIDETEEDIEEPPYIEEVESRSEELVSDIIADIDPLDFEELVAAVLRALGYTAYTTSKGGDFGVDVIAHPDALGFEDPRIKVQVKHTKSSIGNKDIGRFLGTLNAGERGLYISTGGYTRPAQQEARAKGQNVTLLDRDDFIELLLEHYPDLDSEYKSMVPLKSVYVPTGGR
jgi:restriction system protein